MLSFGYFLIVWQNTQMVMNLSSPPIQMKFVPPVVHHQATPVAGVLVFRRGCVV
ncbi:hypothetical protein HanXRQr2_Chr04g0138771 [Helianthus annuus]|uniref:Uncharacterized protein n=1 Tax=Helianthus annuus TaxID=4232 RepID=A0A9K3J3W9_HELAN|nr:hypothetical protein HanXRQr2_Chr04g0138771 [Helianthus annuus]